MPESACKILESDNWGGGGGQRRVIGLLLSCPGAELKMADFLKIFRRTPITDTYCVPTSTPSQPHPKEGGSLLVSRCWPGAPSTSSWPVPLVGWRAQGLTRARAHRKDTCSTFLGETTGQAQCVVYTKMHTSMKLHIRFELFSLEFCRSFLTSTINLPVTVDTFIRVMSPLNFVVGLHSIK